MADKSLGEMSYIELIDMLKKEADFYMQKCNELDGNGIIPPASLNDFLKLCEDYFCNTEPIREELNKRPCK